MIGSVYESRQFYYNFIQKFLKGNITALNLQKRYFEQRHIDLGNDKKNGYYGYSPILNEEEKEFKEQYKKKLYEEVWSPNYLEILKEYEEGAEKLNISGEVFFMGIWNFIDEYVRDYNPSDAEYFNPKQDIGEKELEEKLGAAYEVLERNKERWL